MNIKEIYIIPNNGVCPICGGKLEMTTERKGIKCLSCGKYFYDGDLP